MRIGLDVMGGDYAPQSPLDGVKLAFAGVLGAEDRVVLYGKEEILTTFRDQLVEDYKDRIDLQPCSEVIEMGESPTRVVATKPDSSIMRGLKALAMGEIDVFISAGNTGAVYVGSLYTVKASPGVQRPVIATIVPKENGNSGLLLDVGVNADCKPESLYQFGVLGKIYCRMMFGIDNPKVGLLNIGSEPEKGNLLVQAAYPLFKNGTDFDFVGNVEGYDLFSEAVDVIVCDGFVGNVVLKTSETIYQIMKKRGLVDSFFQRFDFEYYGGTPILGINKPVIIAHGVSTPPAFSRMMETAKQFHEREVSIQIREAFQQEIHG